MKTNLKFAALLLAIIPATTGCWVQSVYPFYEESDVIVDSTLVGQWAGEGALKSCSLNVSFNTDSKTYVIAAVDAGSKPDTHVPCDSFTLEGKLVQLGQQRFVDVVPDEDKAWAALDLLLKVEADKQKLILTPLDAEWTANAMAEKNLKLQGRIQGSAVDVVPVGFVSVTLVSPTSDLRDFLLQHSSDQGAFSQSGQMVFRRK